MCHGINWYYVLCLHPHPSPLIHIACADAIQSGEYCHGFESICIPMIGACDDCNRWWLENSGDGLVPTADQYIRDYGVVSEESQHSTGEEDDEFHRVIF